MVELCLLYLISKEELYGYALLQKLYPVFPDMQESSMYVILRGLYKSGYIECYTGQISGGPPRKYYYITQTGKEKLDIDLNEWRELTSSLKKLGIF